MKLEIFRRWKARLGVYGLIGWRVGLGVMFIIPTIRWLTQENPTFGQVKASQERYARLRDDLPPQGMVGYVSDLSDEDYPAPPQLVQYAIAPVILVQGTDCCELVIGDFFLLERTHPEYGVTHLTPLIDYGNGVVLYHNQDHGE
jgi:hypothetical protein